MKRKNVWVAGILSLCWVMAGRVAAAQDAAVPGAANAVPAANLMTYDVRKFGATGDGKTLDHAAINKAIGAAAEAGGGTVYVGPGKYLCGSIHMKSNIHLFLDAGAEIIGAPQEANAYDEIEPFSQGKTAEGYPVAYQDGGHCYFHNSLIWGENLHDVSITGLGRINGGGLVRKDGLLDKLSGFSNFGKEAGKTVAAPEEKEPVRLGNKAIALKLCKNVTLKDITIYQGGHFAILVTGCDNMTIDNVTMDTNRDGIDIDACRNVVMSNCRINSPNDDGLCPKASYALGENRIEENMTITNCQMSGWVEGTLLDGTMKPKANGNGRIKFGTEASGGFRNITISNCTFRSCRGLAMEEVDGGIMENITISNITMMDTASYPIYITTGKRNRTGDLKHPSILRHILISNVVATDIEWSGAEQGKGYLSGIQITGLPDMPIEDVRLENIRLQYKGYGTAEMGARMPRELATGYPEPVYTGTTPGYGVFARHVKDLELANVRLYPAKGEMRPAVVCGDVEGLLIDNFVGPVGEGMKMARLEKVSREVIRNSPDWENVGAVERKGELSEPSPEPGKAKGEASGPAGQ
ncbi:MAG TPA: glycosyl hydrolase family 28-related protein [Phycisphaerae bacterium]|nr:glycosyl hydrolase family 28-related protein [Phycisphaerae bacterium]